MGVGAGANRGVVAPTSGDVEASAPYREDDMTAWTTNDPLTDLQRLIAEREPDPDALERERLIRVRAWDGRWIPQVKR